jgi:uncharacterized protein (TIGR04255 family)
MQKQSETDLLPSYERPPVVETVLGVQFETLPEFKNAHLGAFWKSLEPEEWPTIYDAPPLEPQFERFSETGGWSKSGVELKLSEAALPSRLQIKNKSGDRMIQVQNGRLHFNWLGQAGERYPRWQQIREGFSQALTRFIEFVAREHLGDFNPNQWEVTYVNHIPKGSIWLTPNDWGFFNLLSKRPKVGDLAAESFSGSWRFIIPEKMGRLHIQWQHGLRAHPKEEEVVILTLTARGPLPQGSDDRGTILEGLDLGHKTIVRSFAMTMTDSANKHWGLKHASV